MDCGSGRVDCGSWIVVGRVDLGYGSWIRERWIVDCESSGDGSKIRGKLRILVDYGSWLLTCGLCYLWQDKWITDHELMARGSGSGWIVDCGLVITSLRIRYYESWITACGSGSGWIVYCGL